jgi:hypothetical protein
MPLLIASLLGGLIQACSSIAGRVLVSMGLGYVSFTGVRALVDAVKGDVIAAIGAQGGTVVQLAGVLQVGTCINIMISALIVKLTLMGLTNGALTRMLQK